MLGIIRYRLLPNTLCLFRRFTSSRSHTQLPGEDSNLRGDGAIRRTAPYGSTIEQTYAGVLSFLRRNYTRNLNGVDVAVTGIPL
ncbi:unnamed protein product, partial [Rotaria magnacalcarata]